jgi:hypothetical protein
MITVMAEFEAVDLFGVFLNRCRMRGSTDAAAMHGPLRNL